MGPVACRRQPLGPGSAQAPGCRPQGLADAGRTQHPAPRPRLLICEVSCGGCGGCGAWCCHGSLAALSWHPAGASQWQHAWGRVSSSSSEGCGAQEVGHFQLLRCPTVALPLPPTSCPPRPRDQPCRAGLSHCLWLGRPRLTTSVDSHCSMSSMRQAWVTGIWREGQSEAGRRTGQRSTGPPAGACWRGPGQSPSPSLLTY